MPIIPKYTIVCDDVRREDNGKLMFVGVYLEKMIMSEFPGVLPTLCFFQVFTSDKAYPKIPLIFRFENAVTHEKCVDGKGELEAAGTGQGIAIFKFINVKIPSKGLYHFVLEIGEQKPDVVPIEIITPEDLTKLSDSGGKDGNV